MNFAELGLHVSLSDRCKSLGFTEPTPIQQQAIPVVLAGSDLIGCAATGTGKTAAFVLPMLHRLSNQPVAHKGVRALILAPTRELASQITEHLQKLDTHKKSRAVTVVGGANFDRQRRELRSAQIVVATPGRLIDHIENRNIDLSRVEILVLDEADRMLDMGFLPPLRHIIGLLPVERQTLLFSATMLPAVEDLARKHMRRPEIIDVNQRGKAAVTVQQTAYPVALESKTNLLLHLLDQELCDRVLVFTRTRRGAERLTSVLARSKHRVNRIHADRSQPQREAALRGFREGHFSVLVATDIAARGIDVDAISHVINFDIPAAAEDYVHRIGRTGRAGHVGHAVTLLTPVDEQPMRSIERLTGQKVSRILLAEFGGSLALEEDRRPRPAFREARRRSRPFGAPRSQHKGPSRRSV